MPLLQSKYQPPKRIFKNGDISTLYTALFRKVSGVKTIRRRLELADGDFLDLDWSFCGVETNKCIIVFHGLEGNSSKHYVRGTAKMFNDNGFDCCAVNLRNCSGEENRLYNSYHSGKTEDVESVVAAILKKNKYKQLILKGFSLGGNLCLKYAGENNNLPNEIKSIIAVSVPIDLEGCMYRLLSPRNRIYSFHFLGDLKKKLIAKAKSYPEKISLKQIKSISNLKDFDDVYTSKANGFADAIDYYRQSSSKPFLKFIKTPTLIINAKNDSFLSESCYPIEEAKYNKHLFLEMPMHGGHVGFIDKNNLLYNEGRALEFASKTLE